MAAASGLEEVDDKFERQCLREIELLHDQLSESEEERGLLRRKIHVLTAHLTETTSEVERRTVLCNEAIERAERAEAQLGDAAKALLSREMRIHELTQQVQKLEAVRKEEEQARDHWEREFFAAKDDVSRATRVANQLKDKLEDRGIELAGWKTKLQLAVQAAQDLKKELEGSKAHETQLESEVKRLRLEQSKSDEQWKKKLARRDRAVLALESQVSELKFAQERVDERAREMQEKETQSRSSEVTQQLERRRQLLGLEDQIRQISTALEKSKVKEILLQRELCRLREELLLCDSQRKTDHRRHEQLLKGKEKQMAFVWQKYVESMASSSRSGPMNTSSIERSSQRERHK